ncbi:MAG TPA: hypothetical protein VF791_00620 [Pyrinomonadaceae bacterium]
MRRTLLLAAVAVMAALFLANCSSDNANVNTTATTNGATPTTTASPTPPAQNLEIAGRPDSVKTQMAERGEQDQASPVLKFVEPREGQTVTGSTVNVKLDVRSDKGYKPGKDPGKTTGNHIHVILDNQPYEAYYDMGQPFELRNVAEGKHTLRVFASRPWHESYKNAGSFQMVTFTVKGGGDASKPTTTNSGQVMADNKSAANKPAVTNANAGSAAPQREGKDVAQSNASDVDTKKPLLTYSRPKGEYKGPDAAAIMIDFWLSNAKLQGDGGEYRVRYSIDGGEAKYIDKWGEPIWIKGWSPGKHTVKLELVDKDGNVVPNGDYNSTTREITVAP